MTVFMPDIDATAKAIGADKKSDPVMGDFTGKVTSLDPFKVKQLGSSVGIEVTPLGSALNARVGDYVYCVKRPNGHLIAIDVIGAGVHVLYEDSTGTSGTVTLSESAASFGYMRIYFKETDDATPVFSSVDVCSPNGKRVQLAVNVTTNAHGWLVGRTVDINGTSISNVDGWYGIGKVDGSETWSNTNKISIVKVEAWNAGDQSVSGTRSGSGGGGGEGHTYALSADSQNPLKAKLTEDGITSAGSFTVPDGTTSAKGAVQLETSTSSTSETKAATPKAVKDALDAAKAYADSIMPSAVQSGSNLAVE